jgi:uncharacterized RDD family membrane protein YckC
MKKADSIHRGIAKTIDFVIMGILCTIPSVVGIAAACLYVLISDGFFKGQSLGKKLIGLRVVVTQGGDLDSSRPCTFRESLVRNFPYAAVIVLGVFPFLGWLLFFTVGFLIIGIEAYFAYTDDRGVRLGDVFADTQVVDDTPAKT